VIDDTSILGAPFFEQIFSKFKICQIGCPSIDLLIYPEVDKEWETDHMTSRLVKKSDADLKSNNSDHASTEKSAQLSRDGYALQRWNPGTIVKPDTNNLKRYGKHKICHDNAWQHFCQKRGSRKLPVDLRSEDARRPIRINANSKSAPKTMRTERSDIFCDWIILVETGASRCSRFICGICSLGRNNDAI